MSQPVTNRPARLAPPIAETASAAPPAETPRSVSSAAICVMEPFCATELMKSTDTRIQNTRERNPSTTVTPSDTGADARPCASAGRSRTNSAPHGTPIASTIAPTAPPDITTASAMPRRRTNQLETARVYAICAVPLATMPMTKKTA